MPSLANASSPRADGDGASAKTTRSSFHALAGAWV
jgi:hypothetical protein